MDSVSDEVQEYLLKFYTIDLDFGKFALELGTGRYFPDLKIVF